MMHKVMLCGTAIHRNMYEKCKSSVFGAAAAADRLRSRRVATDGMEIAGRIGPALHHGSNKPCYYNGKLGLQLASITIVADVQWLGCRRCWQASAPALELFHVCAWPYRAYRFTHTKPSAC